MWSNNMQEQAARMPHQAVTDMAKRNAQKNRWEMLSQGGLDFRGGGK